MRPCLRKTEHFLRNRGEPRVQMTTLPFPLVFFRLTLFVDHIWPDGNAFALQGGRRSSPFDCKTTTRVSLRQKADVLGNLLETLELPAERLRSPRQRRLSVSLIKNICLDDTAVSPAKCGNVICIRQSGEWQGCDELFNFSFALNAHLSEAQQFNSV